MKFSNRVKFHVCLNERCEIYAGMKFHFTLNVQLLKRVYCRDKNETGMKSHGLHETTPLRLKIS